MRPRPRKEDVDFILEAISDYLTVEVRASDVLSAWSGIRPLASDPTKSSTENLTRDHIVATGERKTLLQQLLLLLHCLCA